MSVPHVYTIFPLAATPQAAGDPEAQLEAQQQSLVAPIYPTTQIRRRGAEAIAHIAERLANYTGSGEGSTVPPRQRGEFRVPFVTRLQVARSQEIASGGLYTLTWISPESLLLGQIDSFNVYVALTPNQTPQLIHSAQDSPAYVRVTDEARQSVTFYVQTVLKSGLASDLAAGPSVSVRVQGLAAKTGTATLVAGTVTVTTSLITANTIVVLTGQNSSGTAGELTISARTAGVSFVITSASGTDTRSVGWMLVEP